MRTRALSPDRRGAPRHSVKLAARIRLEHGVFLACTVQDISAMGACVELAYEAFVPLQFRLQIPDDLFEAECLLKHRRGRTIGLEFVSSRPEAMARYG